MKGAVIPAATSPRVDFNVVAEWANANAVSIVGRYGVELGRDGRGPCPLHGGTGRNLSINENGWYCHSGCGEGGDITDFVRRLGYSSLPKRDGRIAALRELGELMTGSPLPRTAAPKRIAKPKPAGEMDALRTDGLMPSLAPVIHTALVEYLGLGPLGYEYLKTRGLDPDVAKADGFRSIESLTEWSAVKSFLADSWLPAELRNAGLASFPWKGNTPALAIPYQLAGTVYGLRFRNLRSDAAHDDRYRDLAGASVPLPYNADALVCKGRLWVVEGELNAYTLKTKGLRAVGVPGAGRFRHEWLRLLTESVKRPDVLVLWYDADTAGKLGLARFLKWLPKGAGTLVVESDSDANEMHLKGELDQIISQPESSQ